MCVCVCVCVLKQMDKELLFCFGLKSVFVFRSFKFGRKINYVSYLSELEDVVKCDQLIIPNLVKE